jgi:glycosyltransferase involved in cell wall biosynthesis
VLYRLIKASRFAVRHGVVSLSSETHYRRHLESLGVQVEMLSLSSSWLNAFGLLRLPRIIKAAAPDVVQTWMYHSDLVGGLAARWVGTTAVVWSVRHSQLDRGRSSLSARLAASACARLSRWVPKTIVSCSEEAARVHRGMGYCATKFAVIPNGYDLVRFAPNEEQRAAIRSEFTISPAVPFLGMVARWHPDKDHDNLLHALAGLLTTGQDFRCVLVGPGMTRENPPLVSLLARLGLIDRVHLTGPREDVPAILNALDVHVLSSSTEAFPNTVAEAMACGTPCVCTDVGDAAHIVGDAGWIVPPGDSRALALGIQEALREISASGREMLKRKCRKRIEENFALERMVEAYVSLWRKVAGLRAEPR